MEFWDEGNVLDWVTNDKGRVLYKFSGTAEEEDEEEEDVLDRYVKERLWL